MLELAQNAQDAIAGWINAQHPYPPIQDPSNWQLTTHQQIIWIMVDMNAWRKTIEKNNVRDATTDEKLSKFIAENEDWKNNHRLPV